MKKNIKRVTFLLGLGCAVACMHIHNIEPGGEEKQVHRVVTTLRQERQVGSLCSLRFSSQLKQWKSS